MSLPASFLFGVSELYFFSLVPSLVLSSCYHQRRYVFLFISKSCILRVPAITNEEYTLVYFSSVLLCVPLPSGNWFSSYDTTDPTKSFAHPDSSVYTLDLPRHMNIFPTFHVSLLKLWKANDPTLFATREHARPGPIVTEDRIEEWKVESIIDHHR